MKHLRRLLTVLLPGTALLLGACTTTGMGGGELTTQGQRREPVQFSWKSNDGGITGTMLATLPGSTYQGRFFQITQQTQREVLAPLWVGWNNGWSDWPYWGGPFPGGPFPEGYGGTEFITHYSGKVLANLSNPQGQRMRCRFVLMAPRSGMAGGGQGECQLSNGSTINAVFDPK